MHARRRSGPSSRSAGRNRRPCRRCRARGAGEHRRSRRPEERASRPPRRSARRARGHVPSGRSPWKANVPLPGRAVARVPPVTDVLMYADTARSPELRHEVPVGVGDPFLYVERDGVRHVVISSLETERIRALGGIEVHPFEEFGFDELRRSGKRLGEIFDEMVLRAVRELGLSEATVPWTFPVMLADRLRAEGIGLTPDRELFDQRRRVKSPAELAGIRRAQAAAEAGMAAARDLLRQAQRNGGDALVAGGEPLTSERLKLAIMQAFVEHGATADEFI